MPSWAGQDYAPFISPDGRYLIYQSDRPAPFEASNLWYSINENSSDRLGPATWTVPRPLRFPLEGLPSATMQTAGGYFECNSDGFEGMPFVLFDKGTPVEIFFTSAVDSRTGRSGFAGLNLYSSRYLNDRWEIPEHLTLINSEFDERMPALSPDGRKLFFSSNRPGGYGGFDIWYSERDLTTGRWAPPVNAGSAINTAADENAPSLVDDLLVFSSNRSGGLGHFDLYSSYWDGERWSTPANLGAPFNSPHDDEYFSVTGDRAWVYFTSDRSNLKAPGEMDLYRASFPERLRTIFTVLFTGQVIDGTTRKLLGVEATLTIQSAEEKRVIRSQPFIKNPGELTDNFAIELKTGRYHKVTVTAPGFHPATLELDYLGNIPARRIDRHTIALQPILTGTEESGQRVTGIVIDDETEVRLPDAMVQVFTEGKEESVALSREATFALAFKPPRAFQLKATHPLYLPYDASFPADARNLVIRLKRDPSKKPPEVNGDCKDDEPGCLEILRVYFDLDKSDLRRDALLVLDRAAAILKKHPEVKIEIEGHADRRFTFQYNQALSEARARSVEKALIERGIAKERLSVQGYSFSRPLSPSDDDRNRRVSFKVLGR